MACQRKCNKKLKHFTFEIQLPNYENSYNCCGIPDVRGLDVFHSAEVLMGDKAIGIAADHCVQSAAVKPVWLMATKTLTINEVSARGIQFRMTAQDVVYSTWARGSEGALAKLTRATWSRPNVSNLVFNVFGLRQPKDGEKEKMRRIRQWRRK